MGTKYGKAFKILRSVFDIDQAVLSELLEVDPSYISRIESGSRRPSQEVLDRLSTKLKIPIELIDFLAMESNSKISDKQIRDFGIIFSNLLKSS